MIRTSPKGFFRNHSSVIVTGLFGSLSFPVILCIALLIISLDWFSTAVNDIINEQELAVPLGYVRFLVFPGLLVAFWYYARKTSRRVHTEITERVYPRLVKVLVVFLSPKGKGRDDALVEGLIDKGGNIEDDKLRKSFEGSWRMPLEGIAHHVRRLERVIVIPSKETKEDLELFRNLIQSLTSERTAGGSRPVEVLSPSELDGLHEYVDQEETKKYSGNYPVAHVDFENARNLNTVLNAVLDWLMIRENMRSDEIMIDVTGGKKISSVVGTVVSLGNDWSIQYVSTSDYSVKEYIFTVKASGVRY